MATQIGTSYFGFGEAQPGKQVSGTGILYGSYGAKVSATTAADATLDSTTIPAALLNATGKGLYIRAWGTLANNGNTKAAKITLGATSLGTVSDNTASANRLWYLEAYVIRTGAATEEAFAAGTIAVSGAAAAALNTTMTIGAPTENLNTSLTLAVKATTQTAASDVTLRGWIVETITEGAPE